MYDFSKYAAELNLTVHVGCLFFRDTTLQNGNETKAETETETETSCNIDNNPNSSHQMRIENCDGVKHNIDANDNILFRVTVIIPVRNGQKYLCQCLYSLLSQSQDCGPFQVILIDDGSTDRTADIAESIRQKVCNGTFSLNPGVYH